MSQKIVNQKDFLKNIDFFLQEAKAWKIFVYPTDTVYWIWWIFPETLEKVYKIKQRPLDKKVSIIRPKIWKIWEDFLYNLPLKIPDHMIIWLSNVVEDLRKKWKGWTIIWKIHHRIFWVCLNDFARQIYKDNTLWVRILNHPFQRFVNRLWEPFITTSANISWEKVIRKISDLPDQIYDKVDWIIDGGVLNGRPSVLIKIIWTRFKVEER